MDKSSHGISYDKKAQGAPDRPGGRISSGPTLKVLVLVGSGPLPPATARCTTGRVSPLATEPGMRRLGAAGTLQTHTQHTQLLFLFPIPAKLQSYRKQMII